tara:strand:+ start:397 stop:666 length:270 start_codon:yes stop_codon:yes gene_type:complete
MWILLVLLIILVLFFIGMYIDKNGLFEDEDDDYIPDVAEKFYEELAARAKEVSREAGDVVDSIKEVGNQIGDIPKAVAGKKRSGRKPQK